MSQYDMNPLDDEEERKRREQEAIAARMDAEAYANPVGPVEPSFLQNVGTAIGNRFNAAVDKAGQTLMNPGQAIQQSLMNGQQQQAQQQAQQQQQEAANTEVQTQTTKTYADGSREHTVKTQESAPQAQQAPMSVMGPVAPNTPEAQQQAEQQAQAFAQQFAKYQQQAPQNRAIAQPQAQPQAQPRPQFNAPQLQSGQGPTQIPQGFQANSVPAQEGQVAAAPGASLAQTAAQMQPTPYTPTAERMTEPMSQENIQHQAVIDARNMEDPEQRRQAYAKLLVNPDVNPGTKALANRFIADDYIKERNIQKANDEIAKSTPNDLARYMKEQNKEGSWVKAILLQRLGFQAAAERELDKIDPVITMSSAVDSKGNKYAVGRDNNGMIRVGFDAAGKQVGQETIANLSAAAMPTKAHLMPGVHGGLMQKTVPGPDGKPMVVTGVVKSDPQTNTTYFEANNTRYDTSGLTTPAQNVEQKFLGAQATKSGEAAGEGHIPQRQQAFPGASGNAASIATSIGIPIISGNRDTAAQKALYDASVANNTPGRLPNGNPVAKPGTSKHEIGQAVDIDTAKLTEGQKKILANNGFFQPMPEKDPNHWEIDPNKAAQGTPVYQQKTNAKLAEKQGEANINVREAAQTARAKKNAETIDEKLDQLTETQYQADTGMQALQSGNHLFGGGLKQAEYFRQQSIPLQERTADFNNTQAILKLAATDNLQTLSKYIKPLSNSDLAYIEKYNINERTSPAEVRRWLDHYYRAASAAYARQAELYNNPQAPAGKAPPPLSPSGGTASQIPGQNTNKKPTVSNW